MRAEEIDLHWAGWGQWDWSPYTWIRRVVVRGLSGQLAPDASSKPAESAPAKGWPRILEVEDAELALTGPGWGIDLRGLDILLDEDRSGFLRVASANARAGQLRRQFSDLGAVTAWRAATAYFGDLSLGPDVVIDALSVALAGPPALTLKARVGGGYVYADVGGGGEATQAAVNALDLSLAGLAEFAGIRGDMAGTVDLAKLTFNGDPARPLSAQISLRLEARDFAWRGHAVEEFTAGLSVAGRRLRLNEFLLRQKSNEIKLRGTATLSPDLADWHQAPFEFEVDAQIGTLRTLAGLFGAPWNGWSGGLRVAGRGSGQGSEGEGWLKVRGWDLKTRGVPAGTMQADLRLEGRRLLLDGFHVQSGPDFARGAGHITVGSPLSYEGRLELRVREVSRYLEPLGRLAPDWAREGGVLLFWDGDGAAAAHSGVFTLELVRFTGDLNPVPLNGKVSASYSPGNIYLSRLLLDRGPLSLSTSVYFGGEGLTVQGLEMFSGRSRLLRGELFLPLSLEAVLAGRAWEQTVLEDGEIYASLVSDKIDLESLAALFGQQAALHGKAELSLSASGPWGRAAIGGKLSADGLRAGFPSLRIPDSQATLVWEVQDRRARMKGGLRPRGSNALNFRAEVPLIGREPAGTWTLIDTAEPWDVLLELPGADLAQFAPAFAGAVFDRGMLAGKIRLTGSPSTPQAEGSFQWKGGRVSFPGAWVPMADVHAGLAFKAGEVTLEDARGRMGEGTFALAGKVDFSDPRNPSGELRLKGENLEIYADRHLRLRAAADLAARGAKSSGEIAGSLGLDGSAVPRSLRITPRLDSASPSEDRATSPPQARPWGKWTLDLKITSSAPIPVGPGGTAGSLSPDLYLQGTVAEPLLLGTVLAERLQVGWPSGAGLVAGGRVHFTKEKPWMPVLDLAGAGAAGAYEIRAGVFGPLADAQLLLSSVPPLGPEQMVVLLTTGEAPVTAGREAAPSTPEEKLGAEPSWLDLDKVRGLLGWGTAPVPGHAATGPDAVAAPLDYGWDWQ